MIKGPYMKGNDVALSAWTHKLSIETMGASIRLHLFKFLLLYHLGPLLHWVLLAPHKRGPLAHGSKYKLQPLTNPTTQGLCIVRANAKDRVTFIPPQILHLAYKPHTNAPLLLGGGQPCTPKIAKARQKKKKRGQRGHHSKALRF